MTHEVVVGILPRWRASSESSIAEELKRRKWKVSELHPPPKGAAVKLAVAARIRAETTMTARRIAEHLGMGCRGYLNHLLYRRRKSRRE